MRSYLTILILAVGLPAHAGLPEFPFCPLGGPSGWFNEIFDDDDYRYPPPYYRPAYYPVTMRHPGNIPYASPTAYPPAGYPVPVQAPLYISPY